MRAPHARLRRSVHAESSSETLAFSADEADALRGGRWGSVNETGLQYIMVDGFWGNEMMMALVRLEFQDSRCQQVG